MRRILSPVHRECAQTGDRDLKIRSGPSNKPAEELMPPKPYIIAEVKQHTRGLDAVAVPAIVQRLDDATAANCSVTSSVSTSIS